MGTTYTPDPTATQAPAAQPDPDNFPALALPADGDALNVAGVLQAWKSLGDYVAWIKQPRAAAAAFTQAIRRYKNALLQDMAGVDHFGFWRESACGWIENWEQSAQYDYSGGPSNRAIGRWHQELGGATGVIDNPPPGAGFASGNPFVQQRAIRFTTGIVANDFVSMTQDDNSAGILFTDDSVISIDFPAFVDGFANITYAFGLMGSGNAPDLNNGAYFFKDNSFPQWQCQTVSGGTTHQVSSGVSVAANTVYRFRVVLIGANRDDSSTARALFFINEAQVANITVDIPLNNQIVPAFYVNPNASAAAQEFAFGAVRYRQTIYPGGIF